MNSRTWVLVAASAVFAASALSLSENTAAGAEDVALIVIQGGRTPIDAGAEGRGAMSDSGRITLYPDLQTFHLEGDVYIRYPRLSVGDVVPMFGHLCRARRRNEFVGLRKDERPEGLAMQEGSFTVPLRDKGRPGDERNGMAKLHDTKVFVDAITVVEQDGEQTPQATVRTVKPSSGREIATVRVQAGDVLTIGDKRHRVRGVVPRSEVKSEDDSKSTIIGWVEFDPRPLDESPTDVE